jgi:hypothetical protein
MRSSSSQVSDGRDTLGAFPFVLAGLSYIPAIGVLFGIVTIMWGLITKRRGGRKLASIGAGGICLSVVLYGGIFYFGHVVRGGVYDDLRTKMAQNNLNAIVKDVEFYRLTRGQYPESLADLKRTLPKDSPDASRLIDPRAFSAKKGDPYFYYKKMDADHYYLRGVASDGKPFSPDALVPQVAASTNLGLLIAPPQSPGIRE